jgi:ATP-dependent Clp protease ATP-binding subunit ClpA
MEEQPQITNDLNDLFNKIHTFTAEKGHEMVLPEHILYLLLKNKRIQHLLENLDADIEELQADLDNFFDTKVQQFDKITQPIDSLAATRILNGAVAKAFSAEKEYLDVVDFFIALMEESGTHALFFLRKAGIERFDVIKEISWNDYKPEEFESYEDEDQERHPGKRKHSTKTKEKYLNTYAVNLTELAKKGEIDPIIGRTPELKRLMQILHRRKKNNPLLVGEPGVGKTAIVEGLALKIAQDQVPKEIKGLAVWALDMGSLVAGTKYRGEFENRLKSIIDELVSSKDSALFLDEIHTVVGAGAVSSGALDASNILKPALQSGKIRCIGATTYEDYKNSILKDKAFSRRFQKIDINEPSESEAVAILAGLKPYYEEHHQVTFSLKALEKAVKLSSRHLNERFLPDKAIDVIDEAGARNSLHRNRKKTINVKDIEEVIASMANIPSGKVSSSDMSILKDLENELKLVIFGQDQAIHNVAKAVKIHRSGIGNKDKPAGSYLFAGPTGCGKTELAKQLAAKLEINFKRFDMSEYSEKHTISKLIGAPPGYVGFEQSGLLTETMIKTPHCVLLLDEIEKAHEDIYNVLLQIMDYGTLTDNNGRKADFRNAIIIMTSNVGSQEIEKNDIGFSGSSFENVRERSEKAVNSYFKPEFRNRLDATVHFNSLSPELMEKIADKFLNNTVQELSAKKITLEVSSKARTWFAKHGYDSKLGARPMERLVRKEIQEALVDEILFGKLTCGGQVKADVLKDKIILKY